MLAWWRIVAAVAALLTLTPWTVVASEKSNHAAAVSATVGSDAKVNINTATVKELMALKGIGHKVAERIVAYRETHGQFKKAEDLRKVEGVGQGLWERNRERIVTK